MYRVLKLISNKEEYCIANYRDKRTCAGVSIQNVIQNMREEGFICSVSDLVFDYEVLFQFESLGEMKNQFPEWFI